MPNQLLSRAALAAACVGAIASAQLTTYPPMIKTNSPATSNGWTTQALWTVGDTIGNYTPVGIPDGIFAFAQGPNAADVLVNHELGASGGPFYTLKNGLQLKGARISSFKIRRGPNASGQIVANVFRASIAYDTVYDRQGALVTSATQINEGTSTTNGFARFCSSNGVQAGQYGFVDNLYFAGEEAGKPTLPHGGSMWVLDVDGRQLWGVPALGRGAWENATALDPQDPNKVALIWGDDTESAPLYLYIGNKNAGSGGFLDRNGLEVGKLYAWKADNGDLTPQQFNGTGSFRTGSWVEVVVKNPLMAGQPGHDAFGYLDSDTLQLQADTLGCFSFSRPEDVDTNPYDGTQIAFASTGRGQLFPADNWGDVYVVDTDFATLKCNVLIVADADGLTVPDNGIRNPDNLDWGRDGKIYIVEDRSTSPSSLFGAASGIEASVWQLDPITKIPTRIAEIDRTAVAPLGTTDSAPGDIGNWESSGILDVTHLFGTLPNERLLLVDVQAHSLTNGPIGGSAGLVEGGQLLFLSRVGQQ
jgi:secreted PhoX family phosphatase